MKVIAPLRDRIWTREEEIAYALARGIPIKAKQGSPYSIDENLFGRSIEAGMLEDPWTAPPEEPYKLTSDPDDAPAPSELVIGFEQGIPVSLDGHELGLVDLVAELNGRAGAYGIGRIDMIENRAVGIKSREVYEAPAAIVLIQAHRALEDLVLTKAELQVKRELETRWTELVYDGLWFSPLRQAIDAFVDDDAGRRSPARSGSSCARRPRSSTAGARRTRSTPRRSPPTARARRSRTRLRRASSRSPRSRPSSPPRERGSAKRCDSLVGPHRRRGAGSGGLRASSAGTTSSSCRTTATRRSSTPSGSTGRDC